MYVAVRDMTLRQAGYATLLEGLRDLELDAIELALGRDLSLPMPGKVLDEPRLRLVEDASLTTLRHAYAQEGIHISGLLLANNFHAVDLEAEIEWVAAGIRLGAALGVDAVRIDAVMTGQQELSLTERAGIYAKAVLKVLQRVPDTQVPLGIENHGYQGNDPQWLQRVLDAVASPRVGLTLDTANFYWAGMPLQQVYTMAEHFAPYVKHVHCKNLSFEPERREVSRQPGWGYGEHVCPIPDGDVDHRRLARLLWEAGYSGGLNIEDESLGKFLGHNRRGQLRRDADHLAEIAQAYGGSRLYRGPCRG
ncbi:MAG: sugar phosphate isomerase/epimerase family protein [Armatimonadia bacterium]